MGATRHLLTIGPENSSSKAGQLISLVADAVAHGETVTLSASTETLSPSQVAQELGISRATVQRRIISGQISASLVGARYRVRRTEVERFRRSHIRDTSAPAIEREYPAVYRDVLFGVLDGRRPAFFQLADVSATAHDRAALTLLQRGGAVIAAGTRWALGDPLKALWVFAAGELSDPLRTRWSPLDECAPLIETGQLVPGSAQAVLAHYDLALNPAGSLPQTIWHGLGPDRYETVPQEGWTPWVPDGLTEPVPLAIAYADLFCTPGWEADEFAKFVLHKLIPPE
ncbi:MULTISPECIES: helix-turn-helix domain-containing protein [Mycolicibacter]|uniref:Helix-turn-helix domain-containing protein n=2 Tax=Mycolicibacter TaxID=1073531 RepID=A0ABU5XM49_9MYCO|nr:MULTISPECIES: helix-turn-helix domain-containing protein [unclassified Mycolicibacter]MEB3023069.1 helix-turn-helix domain-containing protein [Mycolicibacter sp. MYC098]MEB3033579.1 helix-turn-helix domain-containing protein [Mycolicibacter sp. MYC340]